MLEFKPEVVPFVKELIAKQKDSNVVLSKELEKFREDNLYYGTDGFHYALFDGGYINPEDILDDESCHKVYDAMCILSQFHSMYVLCKGEDC